MIGMLNRLSLVRMATSHRKLVLLLLLLLVVVMSVLI